LSFQKAWARKETMNFEGQDFYVVSKEDLIASKRGAGRKIDMEDVQMLELEDEDEKK
jgi:hypothetical protein